MTKHAALSDPLSQDRWKALEPLVDAALEVEGERRKEILDEVSGGDAALRAELEWMVAECDRQDPALERPAIERFAGLFDDDGHSLDTPESTAVVAGRFRLERELGRGGMATVYLAHDLKHGRDVALKMVRPELATMLGGERFLSEIQVTATLRHPHILPLFDSGESNGCLYFVMPYVEGGTLRDRLSREGALPRAEASRIAAQVADGLASAHEHGVVHRDVKPENILLAAGGRHAYVSDFGIALAMSHASRMSETGSWLRVGTRAYMSPEQLEGSADIDGRTDIYSLGCVLHEMLVGTAPRSDASDPPRTGRYSFVATHWGRLRRRLAVGPLERVMRRALAPSPTDRFQTAQELVRELRSVHADPKRWKVVAVAAGVVALGAVTTSLPPVRDRIRTWLGSGIDPDLIVVLPFRNDSTGLAVLSGDNTARLLYDALGRWKDLKLGDEMAAVGAGLRHGAPPATLAEARAVARSLGAGRFIWGEVNDARGVTRISAQLYDQRAPTHPITHLAYLSAEDGAAAKIEEIADSLVAKLVGSPAANTGTSGTHTFAALKRYADGYAALHEWNTELAEQDFRGAVDLDPHFPQAWLGLAQSMAWSGGYSAPDWLDPTTRALADSSALAPRDRLLAGGLLALAQARVADACSIYRKLIARDPRDFAAHFGLGDCLSTDRLVIVDRTSPTGWQFRGSLHTAIQEYRHALALVPSYLEGSRGQTFARLTDRILFNDPGDRRRGFALTPDTVWMTAFPEISSDTLAFYPRPQAAPGSQGRPPTQREAIARNRELLRTLMAGWVEAFPQSGTAWEQYARALESVGVLDTVDASGHNYGALGAIKMARRYTAADDQAKLRLAATDVRILLKLRRFAGAQGVADSTLASRPLPTAQEATVLAPLAALTGRARRTAQLLEIAVADSESELFSDRLGGHRTLPASVLTAAGTFAGYAALGGPVDSVRAARDRLEHMIQTSIAPANHGVARAAVFLPWILQAEPALGPQLMMEFGESRERLVPLWQAFLRGDSPTVQRAIQRDVSRSSSTYSVPAPDVSLQYALLALAIHDTTMALVIIDRAVAALPELGDRLTTETFAAAALPRLALLRARLTPLGQSAPFPSWSSMKILWANADSAMRALADSGDARARAQGSTAGRNPRPH